jgi:thiamine kinase-like enzyme
MDMNEIQRILEQIPEFVGRDCKVSRLEGGLTNKNYKIEVGSVAYVLRLAGQQSNLLGINRSLEYACAKAAATIGVGPEVIAYLPEYECLVTRFLDGQSLTADQTRQPDVLRRMIDGLRRFHNSNSLPGNFSPFLALHNNYTRARDRGATFPNEVNEALELIATLEKELQSDEPNCPCHNDLLPSNFIDDGQTVKIIDWEFAGMGDRYFDLANLAANCSFDEEQEHQLLNLYFGAVTPDSLRRLRLMRLVSDMRECTWGFLETKISTLEVDYGEYAQDYLQRFLSGCNRLQCVTS